MQGTADARSPAGPTGGSFMSRNIVELEANQDVDGERAFERTFSPVVVDELMLEFDPKHTGPPLVVLSNDAGAKKEIHPAPQRGREGRFSVHFAHEGVAWSKVRVSMLRGAKAKLVKVKLIAKAAGPAPTA
jgi:hypothetical protein